jgi:hypothetical protein
VSHSPTPKPGTCLRTSPRRKRSKPCLRPTHAPSFSTINETRRPSTRSRTLTGRRAPYVRALLASRLAEEHDIAGQSGAVLVGKRTSSDLRLDPHVHAVFLDGIHHEDSKGEVKFYALPQLTTEEVAEVLEDAARRTTRYLKRRGLLEEDKGDDGEVLAAAADGSETSGLAKLTAAAVSGMTPPAGPAWRRGALPALVPTADFDRHLSVGRGGFTLGSDVKNTG